MTRLWKKGFTLVELMITIAIAAIILAIAVPSFTQVIKNNRMAGQINELVSSLNLARSEAVKRGLSVTVCKRNAAGTNCNAAGQWGHGWIVFSDVNNDGAFNDDADAALCEAGEDCLLRVHEGVQGGNTLSYGGTRVAYDSRGFTMGFNGAFTLCDDRGATHARGRVLSNTGRLRVAGGPFVCP
jgi:type IV fimbrial biogenesis protein FimT